MNFETLCLTARAAHISAVQRVVDITRNSAYPQKMVMRLDGGFDFDTKWPPEVAAEMDKMHNISRHFTTGCAELAKADPEGLAQAEAHWKAALRLAGVPT